MIMVAKLWSDYTTLPIEARWRDGEMEIGLGSCRARLIIVDGQGHENLSARGRRTPTVTQYSARHVVNSDSEWKRIRIEITIGTIR